MSSLSLLKNHSLNNQPSKQEAEKAVETLLKWVGENPDRDGLKDTPKRVIKAYEEIFSGYLHDPKDVLDCEFSETSDYDDIILVKDINFYSYCEHHIMPIIGKAHVAYIPRKNVVGISKLVRVVEVFSKRLQIQERLTAQIADAIHSTLDPIGTAVVIEAQHLCMSARGIQKTGTTLQTKKFLGSFETDPSKKNDFLQLIK